MDLDQIHDELAKLRYRVDLLSQTVDYENHPVEALVLQMNWEPETIGKIHDVFEKWDEKIRNGEKLENFEFEREFDAFGVTYQSLKSIILAFYRNHQWTAVCEAYVDSFDGTPAVEYHGIMRRERR